MPLSKKPISTTPLDELAQQLLKSLKHLLKNNFKSAEVKFFLPLQSKPTSWANCKQDIKIAILEALNSINFTFDNEQQRQFFITNLPRVIHAKMPLRQTKMAGIIILNKVYHYNIDDFLYLPIADMMSLTLVTAKEKYPNQETILRLHAASIIPSSTTAPVLRAYHDSCHWNEAEMSVDVSKEGPTLPKRGVDSLQVFKKLDAN